jgi:hypothetical protein
LGLPSSTPARRALRMQETTMTRIPAAASFAVLLCSAFCGQAARADFHFWYIKEIFSNYDGSVQFIELFTTAAGQGNLAPAHSISSTSNSFPFPTDLAGVTTNRHMLLATAGFGSIAGGAVPNYVIPSNFFDPAGDTINFGPGVSNHTFGPLNPLPLDGVNSLNYTTFTGNVGAIAANSPRNLAGAGGSVNLPPPPPNNGDYNGDLTVNAADYTVWRNSLGMDVEQSSGADGNNNRMVDAGDYTFWKEHYGEVVGGTGAGQVALSLVPEPTSFMVSVVALGILSVRSLRHVRRAISK